MALEAVLAAVRGRDGAETLLSRFNEQNRATFKFEPSDEEKRKQLCEGILHLLDKDLKTSCRVACLEALRILSRDKKVLVPVTTKKNMQILMKQAKLDTVEEPLEDVTDFPVIVEALKCLCNIVFNSPAAQKLSLELNLAAMLCNLLKKCKDQQFVEDIKCFDLRLLFLLSLLHTDIRSQLRNDLQGLPLLTQALESAFSIRWTDKYITAENQEMSPLSLQETDCAIEALKALFNVTLDSWNVHSENDSHEFRYMTAILRHCLLTLGPTEDKTEELHSNAVNLLSNVPVSCLDVLISPSDQEDTEETDIKYNGMNMDAIQVLLKFMEKRIDKGSSYREGLTPVLSLLTRCCRSHRNIRKFIKAQVLPPLRDVSNRPEVGTTLRNKLVRLMTHVDLGVKQIAAEFLFVLCKERVDSLLKYTGYGNAAGLLAARGLLAGGRGENWYSDDEDTDTEEYKSAKPNINLITGHLEEPMPNPMDEMTEEQKEYEAMKLVNMFDKLSRSPSLVPCVNTDLLYTEQASKKDPWKQGNDFRAVIKLNGKRKAKAKTVISEFNNKTTVIGEYQVTYSHTVSTCNQILEDTPEVAVFHYEKGTEWLVSLRDKVITPMGVRPDGTMTPLEEVVGQHPSNDQESSDSD